MAHCKEVAVNIMEDENKCCSCQCVFEVLFVLGCTRRLWMNATHVGFKVGLMSNSAITNEIHSNYHMLTMHV